MKVALLQVTSPEIENYVFYTRQINQAYCNYRGYQYIETSDIDKSRSHTWTKVKAAIKYLHLFDIIFYLDADAYVNNFSKQPTSFERDGEVLLMCENGPNGGDFINGGSFILYNEPVAYYILEKWWSSAEGTDKDFGYWHEQSIINSLFKTGIDCPVDNKVQAFTKIFPYNSFNSWWLDDPNLCKDQFVIHVMGRPLLEKVNIIRQAFENIQVNLQRLGNIPK